MPKIVANACSFQIKIIVDPRDFYVSVGWVTFTVVTLSGDIVLRFSIAGLESLVKLGLCLFDQAILALLDRDYALELLILSNYTFWIDAAKLICLRLSSSSSRGAPFLSGCWLGCTLILVGQQFSFSFHQS